MNHEAGFLENAMQKMANRRQQYTEIKRSRIFRNPCLADKRITPSIVPSVNRAPQIDLGNLSNLTSAQLNRRDRKTAEDVVENNSLRNYGLPARKRFNCSRCCLSLGSICKQRSESSMARSTFPSRYSISARVSR